jgi:ABC-2 type transport system permease protein
MYHLIKKDFLLQKKNLKLSILIAFFFSVSFSSIGAAGLTYSIYAVSYLLALGASALEEKNNSDIFLVSLPIKKNNIVLSKYVSVYVFTAYSILLFYIIVLIEQILKLPFTIFHFTFNSTIMAVTGISILCSIAYPLIFKFGYLKAKMIITILFLSLIFGTATFTEKLVFNNHFAWSRKLLEFFKNTSIAELTFILLVPLTLILLISYRLSLTFYQSREF